MQGVNEVTIRPKISNLENDKARYECPLPSCTAVLKGIGFFPSHMRKVHNVVINEGSNNGSSLTLQCFCPLPGCKYSGQGTGDRHFTSLKLLRQHFMKVHAEKKFKCERCGLSFGLDRDRRLHQGRCGQIYKCTDCEVEYSTNEALQTHCLRNGHKPPGKPPKIVEKKMEGIKDRQSVVNPGKAISTQTLRGGMVTTSVPVILVDFTTKTPVERDIFTKSLSMKPILPKPSVKLIVPQQIRPTTKMTPCHGADTEITIAEELRDISTETTNLDDDVLSRSVSEGIQASIGDKNLDNLNEEQSLLEKSWSSTGIQTAITFKPQRKKQLGTVAQTQTTGDMILKKAMASADIPINMESVGTQMTPQLKGQSFKRRTCTIETQTHCEGPAKNKKSRKSLLNEMMTDSVSQTSGTSNSKSDSMCQVDNFRHFTLVDISKSSTTQAAQTDKFIRIDTMSQTKEPLLGGPQTLKRSLKRKKESILRTENPNSSVGSYDNSNISQQIPNIAVQFKTRITTPRESPFSDAETGPILSVTEQRDSSEERTLPTRNPSSESAYVQATETPPNPSSESAYVQATETPPNPSSESAYVQATETTRNPSLESTSVQATDTDNEPDIDVSNGNKGHDMGIQTFEADFERFLLSQCENMENPQQTESQVQTQNTASDMDILLQMSDKDISPTEISMDTQTQTVDLDTIDRWVNNMETQTSTDSAFNSFSFNDIETQTLPDLSLISEESNFMNDFSLTSIQTQTMEDDLCQSLSTQTDGFLEMFDFSLTSIHTQTSEQSGHASTQTSHTNCELNEIGIGCDFTDVIYSSNTETQTADLSLSDTHTQTAWDDLNNLLKEFQK